MVIFPKSFLTYSHPGSNPVSPSSGLLNLFWQIIGYIFGTIKHFFWLRNQNVFVDVIDPKSLFDQKMVNILPSLPSKYGALVVGRNRVTSQEQQMGVGSKKRERNTLKVFLLKSHILLPFSSLSVQRINIVLCVLKDLFCTSQASRAGGPSPHHPKKWPVRANNFVLRLRLFTH